MSHMIETMTYVGATPWHELGVKLDAPPTTREAIVAAGLDWEVGLKDLVTTDGTPVTHRATYRKSDQKILGVVGPSYCPIQNASAFDWFDPFVTSGEATIETAGSLEGGKRIWVLAKLSRDPSEIVPGDVVQKYLLLANAHDGTLAGRVGFTPVRVVCHNTLSMATEGGESKLVRVFHTKNAVDVLAKVRDIMNLANQSFEATADQYRYLAGKQVCAGDLEKYVKLVFPPRVKPVAAQSEGALAVLREEVAKRSPTLEAIRGLFEDGAGNQLPGVRGTYWAAYNAVTEYVTHHRGRDAESRLNASFSDGALINRRALSSALAMAA